MKPFNLTIRWAFWSLLASAPLASQAADYQIPRVQGQVKVDGELAEEAWTQAKTIELLYNTWPADNTPAPVQTTAQVMEDGENLYVSFIAKDPHPEQIRAYFRDRDKIWEDDMVGIKLDTYNDSKLAYEFFINPHGVQADAIENELTKMESDAWDGIWHSAGKLTVDGYQVEVAIPLRLLNFNDRLAQQTWKLELLRFYPRDVRHRLSASRIERSNPCWICQMDTVQGFAGATQGNHFTLVPSVVASTEQTRDITVPGSDWQTEGSMEPSLDLKWGITPDINLNMTVNPDFSQIEADEAQVSMNDAFALFFDEKRPFFLDNADYFYTPLDLVYTRNVSQPDAGLKITGRHDQQSFAFFAANDKSTTFIIPGNISSDIGFLDEKSNNAVLRYRYDVGSDLSVGWLSTLREAGDYHNFVHGIDTKYKITDQDKIVAQWLYSDSAYPAELAQQLSGEAKLRAHGDDLSDNGGYLAYEHDTGVFNWYSRYLAYGENFRADMGYMPQTDWNKMVHGAAYNWFSEQAWWNHLELRGDWDITHNEAGELLEKEAEVEFGVWGPWQSEVHTVLTNRDRVGSRLNGDILQVDSNTGLFTEKTLELSAIVQPTAGVYYEMESEIGKKLDFRNNRMGDGLHLMQEVRWNADVHTQLGLRHTYRTLDANSAEVFTVNLTDLRLSYQFSVQSFVRIALIYSSVHQNPLNNLGDVTARSRDLGTQLLYSYKINPQTLFFAGYSDHAMADDDIQGLTRDDRSVFLKFSYAWML